MALAVFLLSGLLTLAPHGRPRPPAVRPPAPVTSSPSRPNPVNVITDLNAAVVPPASGSLDDTPAALRDHEQRTQDAFDPNSPSNRANYRASGDGCQPGNGALLSCATNRQVANQTTSTTSTVRDQTPDRDLMGRPR